MHYAAFISSSILSGHRVSSSARSAVRAIVHSVTAVTGLRAEYGSDGCSRWKGKCRELPVEGDGYLILDTFYSTSGLRAKLFQTPRHLRRIRRFFANAYTHSDVFRTSPSYTMFRRGVASAASIPKRQTASLSSGQSGTQSTHILNFRDKNFPRGHTSLQEVWDALSVFRNEEDWKALDTRELLSLGGMILKDTDAKGEVLTNPVEWGNRLERLVVELKRRAPFRSSEETVQLECLAISSQALRGYCDEAATALAVFLYNDSLAAELARWILDSFKHVLLSLLRNVSAARAVEFYLDHFQVLKVFLTKALPEGQTLMRAFNLVFPELSAIFRAMDSPASFLASINHLWDRTRIIGIGATMLRVLCREGLAEDAAEVYEELKRQNIPVRYFLEHALVRVLTKKERYERANLLYLSIVPKAPEEAAERSYDATGLYLFAHQGDVGRAEECFERLSNRGGVFPQEMNLVMHASAVRGDANRAEELFNEFFGNQDEASGSSLQRPNSFHYSTIINAHAVRDDVDEMNYWLGRMLEDGCAPDVATYNIVLKGVAQRDDFKAIEALLDQMRDAGVPPNGYSYTTVIKILARRRDVLGAEAVFKRMIREGIAIDRIAVTTLMNAHVEAGSWRGVIRVFDFISRSREKDVRLGVEVFNTLLKAYVLIGAPLEVVIGIFRKLESTNIKPTNRTFALLIQSACASNRMDIASRLFVEMEELEKDWTTDVEVTKEALTIIMSAYLRQGNRTQARVIYEDMQKRGIQPTAYTYASILRSYSDVALEENLRIAQEFLDSLVSQPSEEQAWVQPASGRDGALAYIYAPLMNAHTKKLDVESAEQLYQDFIDHNKHPTVGILALLMDAYRRVGDIENVKRVWPEIVDLAFERTDEVDKLLDAGDREDKFFRSRRRGDLLCIPLSIYIDSLSHAGQHIEIAHTWNKLREAGFQFDSHNWNHLVVALVRAGQPLRAFEVVEKVIIPYQLQSHSILRTRDEKVDSPLVFDDEETRAEIEDEPFIVPMERSWRRKPSLIERLRRRFGRGRRNTEDLAHELHLMQQISPEWNVWRPHNVTLQVLARVLERLDSGWLIRPTKPHTRPPIDEDDPEAEYVQDQDQQEQEEQEEQMEDEQPSDEEAKEAQKLLNQILTDYPQTIVKIDKWESETVQNQSRESKRAVRETRYELRQMGRMSG